MIEIGYMSDPIKVMSLLERRNHRWGDKNLMELSHIGHLRSFIASKQSITLNLEYEKFLLRSYYILLNVLQTTVVCK